MDYKVVKSLVRDYSYAEIARKLNVTPRGVQSFVRRNHLSQPVEVRLEHRKKLYSHELRDKVVPLLGSIPYTLIAKKLNISLTTVKYYAKKVNFRCDHTLKSKFTTIGLYNRASVAKRKLLFGLPTGSKIKYVLNNKESVKKSNMRYQLKCLGYLIDKGSMNVTVTSYVKRHLRIESSAKRLGFNFKEI